MVSQWNLNLMQDQQLLSFAFTSKTIKLSTLLSFNQFSIAAIIFFNYKTRHWVYIPQLARKL